MLEPLLPHAEPEGARPKRVACACLRRGVQAVVRAVRRYFEITRSPAFRQSRVSRRFLWKYMFPFGLIGNVCDDHGNGGLRLPWEEGFNYICAIEWMANLPTICRTPCMFMYGEGDIDEILYVLAMLSNCTLTRSLWEHPDTPNSISTCLPCLVAFGISFPMVLLFSVGVIIHGEPEAHVQEATILPLFVILAFAIEFAIASLVTELDVQRRATDRLLDTASDGFCIVDRGSGQVASASDKMKKTLESDDMQGKSFMSHISGFGTWEEFRGAVTGAPLLLVTCRAGSGTEASAEFDAKLIPYSVSGDLLSLCIQQLGERRTGDEKKLEDVDPDAEGFEEDSASIVAEMDQEQLEQRDRELLDDDDEEAGERQIGSPGELPSIMNMAGGSGDGGGDGSETVTLELELPAGALGPAAEEAAEGGRLNLSSLAADLGDEEEGFSKTPEPPGQETRAPAMNLSTPFGPMGFLKGSTNARGSAQSRVGSAVSQARSAAMSGMSAGSRRWLGGGSVIGGSEVSCGSAASYHSICKVGAGNRESGQMETVSAEMVSVGRSVQGNDVVKIEFKSKCLRTQLEWQKKLIDQQRMLLSAASTEVQESKKKVSSMTTMFDEQRGLLRGFRKIITRSLADLAEVARERTVLFVIEEREEARRKLVELCEFSQHEHRCFSSLDQGLKAIQADRGQQTAIGLKQLEPLLEVARSEAGASSSRGSSAGQATPNLSQVSEKLGEEVKRLMEVDASLDARRDERAQVVLLGASMLDAWSKEGTDLDTDVTVALVSESDEFQEVGRKLLAGGEGELRERLRKIHISEYLILPASLDALQGVVYEAARRQFADEYLILEQLGRGASGAIYMTKRLRDGEVFALKEINIRRLTVASKKSKKDDKDKKEKKKPKALCKEWELMRSMPSWPTILPAVDGWENPEDKLTYILMPVMRGGTVADRSTEATPPMEVMGAWYAQTLHALCFLHSRGVVHRDMKPENLLLMADGVGLCVCDFGSAMELSGPGPHPGAEDYVEAGGTTRNPPEVERERRWYAASDMWAAGSTFFDVMRLGPHPTDALFEGLGDMGPEELRLAADELLERRATDERPPWPLDIPDFVADFSPADMVGELLELLHPLSARRPSAAALAARPHAGTVVEALLKPRLHSLEFRTHIADFGRLIEP